MFQIKLFILNSYKRITSFFSPGHDSKKGIYVTCFGKFNLYVNGNYVPIKNRKAQEIMAYLLCERAPSKKIKLSEALWPDSPKEKAMDSLYKACRFIKNLPVDIPLHIYRDEMYLDGVDSDIYEFERLYEGREDIEKCEQAVALYKGALLFDEYYEWSAQAEAFYDIKYCEIVQNLIDSYQHVGNSDKVLFYKGLISH